MGALPRQILNSYVVDGPSVSIAVNSLQEYIACAKANPGKLVYGSPGVGSVPSAA